MYRYNGLKSQEWRICRLVVWFLMRPLRHVGWSFQKSVNNPGTLVSRDFETHMSRVETPTVKIEQISNYLCSWLTRSYEYFSSASTRRMQPALYEIIGLRYMLESPYLPFQVNQIYPILSVPVQTHWDNDNNFLGNSYYFDRAP